MARIVNVKRYAYYEVVEFINGSSFLYSKGNRRLTSEPKQLIAKKRKDGKVYWLTKFNYALPSVLDKEFPPIHVQVAEKASERLGVEITSHKFVKANLRTVRNASTATELRKRSFGIKSNSFDKYFSNTRIQPKLVKWFIEKYGVDRARRWIESANFILKMDFDTKIVDRLIHLIEKPDFSELVDSHFLRDSISMITDLLALTDCEFKLPKTKDVKELHDKLARERQRIKTKFFEFKYTDKEKELEGTFNGFVFTLAQSNHELNDVSTELDNCVASYDSKIRMKRSLIIIVRKNEKTLACIEVRNGWVSQAKMFFNTSVSNDPVVNKAILKWAKKHSLPPGNDIRVN